MNDRIWQFDFLKLLCSFLVIYGHCLLHYGYPPFEHPICTFIYSFHMPLFMVISGYFSKLDDITTIKNSGYKLLISKKVISYVLPYFTMFCISLILTYIVNVRIDSWFLMSVFGNYTITLFIIKFMNVKKSITNVFILILLFLILGPILLHFYKMLYMYPFFVLGIIIKRENRTFIKYKKQVFVTSFFTFIILYILLWNNKCIYDVNGGAWINVYPTIEFIKDNLYLHLLRYIIGASACLLFIAGIFCLPSFSSLIKISKYGAYSLELYLLGLYFDRYHLKLNHLEEFKYNIACFVFSVIIVCLCILISKQIKKVPILNFILFGKGDIAKRILKSNIDTSKKV